MQKQESRNRQKDIRPQNDSGVSGGIVVVGDDLMDVSDGRAPAEERGPENGRQPKMKRAAMRKKGNARKPEACISHFVLKRAVRPTDKTSRHFGEKNVQDEIIQKTQPDREKQIARQKSLRNSLPTARPVKKQRKNRRENAQNQECQREIAENEWDQLSHADAKVSHPVLQGWPHRLVLPSLVGCCVHGFWRNVPDFQSASEILSAKGYGINAESSIQP